MKQTKNLELLRAIPTENGKLELQYCWRDAEPTAQEIIDQC